MKSLLKLTVALSIASSLVGCTQEATPVVEMKKEAVAHAYSKPSAPIELDYKVLTKSPLAGDLIEIEVAFRSSTKAPVKASVSSAEHLVWVEGKPQWSTQLSAKTGKYSAVAPIRVIAEKNGRFYINLVASVEQDGKTQYRPFTIPVQVGNEAVQHKPVGTVVTDEQGQKILIQKGQSSN
ncbi:hypothetical protein [Pleionea sp. CnH1-48]|uniref:hypothetical protein n=1 Tax=Pleionea sp. CnH1-48 TaxID=2954494 RepID=UPI002097CBC8|nr:hypothetical protein [Pleionea sp. CnH1-48]MCO7223489.1 hypothetical protein [Pleionea sp. CnH1-48]